MHVGRGRIETVVGEARELGSFARPDDHAECRRLHRQHGTTYYFATRRFGSAARTRVHALYAFVRVPDEWVDNPGNLSLVRSRRLLQDYRSALIRGLDGVCPEHPVLRAFCDVMHEVRMPLDEPLIFLDAMEQDLSVSRYATYEELRGYMRGSASAVGLMMCSVLGAGEDPAMLAAAKALGEAMQLTNFLRDVGEDLARDRIYLPQDEMAHFGVMESDLRLRRVTPEFIGLMQSLIARARGLYAEAEKGIPMLPRRARKAVRLASVLYSRILDRIEANGYDVFSSRARTSKAEKIRVALGVMLR